jgi:hypothetical protein
VTGTVLAGPVVRAIQDQKVSPGVLGFLVVAALGVATWLLVRSMTRQIRKIDFSEDAVDLERQARPVREPEATVDAGAADSDPDGSAGAAADGDDSAGPTVDLR